MDEISTEVREFKNGRVAFKFHNGMTPLRLKQPNGRETTVEEFINVLSARLMYDERIEVGDTSVDVYKTYGVDL